MRRAPLRAAAVIVGAITLGGAALAASAVEAQAESARSGTGPSSASSGCRATTLSTPGETTVSLVSSGLPRTYLQQIPNGYSTRQPASVVVDLHGYGENAAIESLLTGMGGYGNTHGFVTVTPQGRGSPEPYWDITLNGPDVHFIGDLLDHVERTVCVNEHRIYVTGYSNGAFLTSAVACVDAARVAAVAPVAGIEALPGCRPRRPVPILAFHGTADQDVSYSGGLGPEGLALQAPDGSGRTVAQAGSFFGLTGHGPSVPEILAKWARWNGCSPPPTQRAVTSDVSLIRYRCKPDADTELYRVTGGGHTWPGSQFSAAVASIVGPTTMSISATSAIWSFFRAHSLPG
jgi:polyhydroxybutyrate depolymerase